jgi:hypothetical protein
MATDAPYNAPGGSVCPWRNCCAQFSSDGGVGCKSDWGHWVDSRRFCGYGALIPAARGRP